MDQNQNTAPVYQDDEITLKELIEKILSSGGNYGQKNGGSF